MTGNRVIDFLQTIFGIQSRDEMNSRLEALGFSGTSVMKEVNKIVSFSERTMEKGLEKGIKQGVAIGRNEMLDTIVSIRKQYKDGTPVQDLAIQTRLTVEQILLLV